MKRRLERKELCQPVIFYDLQKRRDAGSVVDITTEGVMLVSDRPIKPNCVYRHQISFPEPIKNKTAIDVGMDCLWSRPANTPNKHWSGFQIIDAAEEDLERLEIMIEDLAIN